MSNIALVLIIHLLISIIYFIWWYKKNKEEGIYRLVVVLFIPLVGIAYFLILDIMSKRKPEHGTNLGTLHGIEKDVFRTGYLRVDFQKEINVIPIEEALIINSGTVKRKLIVDILKEDIDKYISFLNKALNDEDTETSHYAAATVMEIKRKLIIALQDLAVRYEGDKTDIRLAKSYADVIKKYLESGFLDSRGYLKYKYIYSNVLKNILELDISEEQYFIDKINCEIELGDYSKAIQYCQKYYDFYPDSETPYIMYMKLFYILKDNKKFNNILLQLKNSDIRFSNGTLNIVRFWAEVGK